MILEYYYFFRIFSIIPVCDYTSLQEILSTYQAISSTNNLTYSSLDILSNTFRSCNELILIKFQTKLMIITFITYKK